MNTILAPLPVVIALGTAAILAALNKFLPRRAADALAAMATITVGGISLQLMRLSSIQPIVYWFGGWTPRAGMALGITFTIDPIGAGLAAFTSVLVLAAFVFSWHYFDSVGTHFHVLILVFLGAMCGFSLTGDLFNMFVFFELMSAAAFALCGYKVEEAGPLQGALNFAVTNTIAAFVVLSGIALLYGRTGALNMAQIGRALGDDSSALVVVAFTFITAGFFVKAAIVPFHFWLADAHAVAPTPVCVLFSGIMVELGLYAVARVYWAIMDRPFATHGPALSGLLLTVGTITAIVGGLMCFGQRHIKRLLAYSTISHMGLMTIGFALLKPDALAGAALYVVGHGLVKASLFLVSGILLHRLRTIDEIELHGRGRDLWGTAALWVFAGLGLAGLPPFATFLGEAAIEDTATKHGQGWLWVVFFLSAVLTAGAVFRVGGRIFAGWGRDEDVETGGAQKIEEEPETTDVAEHPIPAVMFAPAAVLAVLALAVGLIPGVRHAVQTGVTYMADGAGYQARVLDHAWLPVAPPPLEHVFPLSSIIRAVAATICAFGLAGFALSPWWPRRQPRWNPLKLTMLGLRKLHSGHVGDYVALLTLGVAAFGVALSVLIKLGF
ncbi:MAG: complex I subunit 5 family protein [Terriglobales bacterium]